MNDCPHLNRKPILFKNPDNGKIEIDVIVCQDCLQEFCVPANLSLTSYLNSLNEFDCEK